MMDDVARFNKARWEELVREGGGGQQSAAFGLRGARVTVLDLSEWRHALGPVVNGLIGRGFRILGLWESIGADWGAEPGTWAHFKTIAPPWLTLWARREEPRGEAARVGTT